MNVQILDDPLSNILKLLEPRNLACGAVDVGPNVSVTSAAHEGVKCYAVMSGEGWLNVGGSPPLHIAAGECLILPRGLPFRFATDLGAPPVDFVDLVGRRPDDLVLTVGGGGRCLIVSSFIRFECGPTDILLNVLPAIIHIRSERGRSNMRWSLDRMIAELRDPQPGGQMIIEHLAHMVLVEALRLYIEQAGDDAKGWLSALRDRRIGAALAALHRDPSRNWSVRDLAKCAGMSRTSFATHFRAAVGATPIEYLVRWRMTLAAHTCRAQKSHCRRWPFDWDTGRRVLSAPRSSG